MSNQELVMRVETALEELRRGRMLILTDDDSREQEGDLILAAEKVTPEAINFMSKHARGLICLTVTEDVIKRLKIPFMPKRNSQANQAAFAVSIDAVDGISTGISTQDRARTIQVVINPKSTEADISTPGHIFPLQARSGGVLVRPGHTEGSIDLVKLAGLYPAAVISEVLNEDGTMARLPELKQYAALHQLQILSINDIIEYRLIKEAVIDNTVLI